MCSSRCCVCDAQKKLTTLCKSCNEYFCKNKCGLKRELLCKNCVILNEHKTIFETINDAFFASSYIVDVNVVSIIVSYSIGYIVSCCNYLKCDTEITINNRFEFMHYNKYRQSVESIQKVTRDWFGNDINSTIIYNENYRKHTKYMENANYYWYSINKYEMDYDTIKYIYNKEIRIFCAKCLKTDCFPCKYGRRCWKSLCKNGDIIENEVPLSSGRVETTDDFVTDHGDIGPLVICKQHNFCEICGSRETGYDERRYQWEHEDFYEFCEICRIYYCPTCITQCKHQSVDIQALYFDVEHELQRYDHDPLFIKTCKPYSLI